MFNLQYINSLRTFEFQNCRKLNINSLKNSHLCSQQNINSPTKTQKIFAVKVTPKKKSNSQYSKMVKNNCKQQINPQQQQSYQIDDISLTHQLPNLQKIKMTKINSFLLGLTNRIDKEYRSRKSSQLDNLPKQESTTERGISEIKQKYQASYHKNKVQNKHKRQFVRSHISDVIQINKPQAFHQKGKSRKVTRESLPHLQNKKINNSECQTIKEVLTEKKFSPKIPIRQTRTPKLQQNTSKKALLTPKKIVCKKGYLFYHPNGKQFLQKNSFNIHQLPKLINIPDISARNYLVVNRHNLQVIAHKNSDQMIQIASLTKIMTLFLSLLACKKYQIDPSSVNVKISQRAASMVGTSAQLQRGDNLKLSQLFYGLMLPSGNDASVAIAQTMGKLINKNKNKPSKKIPYDIFIHQMNSLANELQIDQTYQNPSGLQTNPNFSTPKAVTILSALAMQNDYFRQIVNTKEYEVFIKNQCSGLIRKMVWKNTNKLLWKDGWCGVKTGTTQAAGHCLMSCKGDYLISVYDCSTLSRRFTQCFKIQEYLRKNMKL